MDTFKNGYYQVIHGAASSSPSPNSSSARYAKGREQADLEGLRDSWRELKAQGIIIWRKDDELHQRLLKLPWLYVYGEDDDVLVFTSETPPGHASQLKGETPLLISMGLMWFAALGRPISPFRSAPNG